MMIQKYSASQFCRGNIPFFGNRQEQKKTVTESRNPKTVNIDLMSTEKLVKRINAEDKKVAKAVEKESSRIAKAIDLISKQFLAGGRLFYFGAGTSGRLGILDASECPPTFSTHPDMVQGIIAGGDRAIKNAVEGAEDNYAAGLEDAKVLTNKDVAVTISASGNPKYLLGVLDKANEIGSNTIAISCNPKGEILKRVQVPICAVVGPEVVTGSSRLKAGTAQKMILNMLTTGSMIKIGKTYENFMVDVKTSNEKLKKRAVSIVSEIAQVSDEKAQAALLESNWKVKTAIVSILKEVNPESANSLLKASNGVLRRVI